MARPDLRRAKIASEGTQAVSLSDFAYRQPIDPRRRPEVNDSRLIQEDQRAVANLPEREINRQFTPGKYMPYYWMESEIVAVGTKRAFEPEDE